MADNPEEDFAAFDKFERNPLANALALAALGNPVIPLWGIVEVPGVDGTESTYRCQCGDPECGTKGGKHERRGGKHPHPALSPNGKDDATTDPAVIRRWFAFVPGINYAVRTGDKWIVFDLDGAKGLAAFEKLQHDNKPLPPTWTVSTGGRQKRHKYFRRPENVANIPNSAGRVGKQIDVRGDGGYVVGPGSRHYSGFYYMWWRDWHPLKRKPASLPDWLLKLALNGDVKQKGNGIKARSTDEWCALAESQIPDGERHDALIRFAGHLLSTAIVDPRIVRELMVSWGQTHCDPPAERDYVEDLVADLLVRENKKLVRR